MLRFLILFLLSFSIMSCSTINQRLARMATKQDTQYLSSYSNPNLQVPAGLDNSWIRERYVIPAVATQGPVKEPNLVPPGSLSNSGQTLSKNLVNVRPLQTVMDADELGNPVMYITGNYKQIYPAVGSALVASGYTLTKKQADVDSYFILLDPKMPLPYQLHFTKGDTYVAVTLLDIKNKPADPGISKRVLVALANHLHPL